MFRSLKSCVLVQVEFVKKTRNTHYENSECENLNWRDKVQKIKQTLNLWRQRMLKIHGRVTVINSLLMSKLWYSLSVIPIPFWARDSIQKECINFLWKCGVHLLSYKTAVGDRTNGGLRLVDIYLKMLSFRLKFLTKYLCATKQLVWKTCFYIFFNKNLPITRSC